MGSRTRGGGPRANRGPASSDEPSPAEAMQHKSGNAGRAAADASTNHAIKPNVETPTVKGTRSETSDGAAPVPSLPSPPSSSMSPDAQWSSPFATKTENQPAEAMRGKEAERSRKGIDDANDCWSTATSASMHQTIGADSELSIADTCLLEESATRGLRVLVSPTGFKLDKSEPTSADTGELSARTVRFQPGEHKRVDGATPPLGSPNVGFCRGHGLCALCTIVAALPAVLSVIYVLNIWVSADVRWRSFCQEYDANACVSAMKSLQELLSPTVEPCDNMYAYVCDQWDHVRDPHVGGASLVDSAVANFYERVHRELLSGPPKSPNVFGRHVLQRLYTSCNLSLSEATAKALPLKPPTELAPLLTAGRIDVLMRAVLDTALRWGLEVLWGIRLERNKYNGSYVHVYAGRSLAQKMDWKSKGISCINAASRRVMSSHVLVVRFAHAQVDAKRYLKQVVDSLGNPRFTAAVVGAVFRLDEAVREELCCTDGLNSSLVPLWKIGSTTTRVTAYQWLQSLVQHKWLHEPHDGIYTMVLVTGLDQIRGAHMALKQHRDNVVQLYMYLLASLEILQYDYRKHVYQQSHVGSGIVQACMEATRKVLTPAWPYVIADVTGHSHLTVALGDMYERLSLLTADNPYSASMDNATRFRAANQISSLMLDAFPAFLPVKGVDIINFDSTGFVLRGNFPVDYLGLLKTSQVLPRERGVRLSFDRLADDQAKAAMEVSPLTRSLVVPTAYTMPPLFYEEDLPESFNYGTLGVLIAKQMSEVVAPGSPLLIPDGTVETPGEWWTEASRRSLNKTMQCWQRQLSRTEPNSSRPKTEPDLERSLFVWSRAVRIAFDALRRLVERRALRRTRDVSTAHEHWLLQQRVFFARFCLLACSSAGIALEGGPLALGRRCTLPLLNMREFHSAHNCTARNETSFCHDL